MVWGLNGLDPLVKGLLCVAGKDRDLLLGQDRPVVHSLGRQVDGRTGYGHARGQRVPHGVPALERGKEGRMGVEDASREGGEDLGTEDGAEAGHRHHVHPVAFEHFDQLPGISGAVEVFPVLPAEQQFGGHSRLRRHLKCPAAAISQDHADVGTGAQHGLQDRPATRGQHSQAHLAATARAAHAHDSTRPTRVDR